MPMATTTEACSACGAEATTGVGQYASGGELQWNWGQRCDACGAMLEADDRGFPPEKYRALMQDQHGVWNVVADATASRSRLGSALKTALGLELLDAIRMAKNAPGVVWTGTEVEAEWMLQVMRLAGVTGVSKQRVK